MSQPRARKAKAAAPKPQAVFPEFNQADEVVNDLTSQIAQLSKDLSVARAAVRERDAFISANAALLGLDTVPQATPVADEQPASEESA